MWAWSNSRSQPRRGVVLNTFLVAEPKIACCIPDVIFSPPATTDSSLTGRTGFLSDAAIVSSSLSDQRIVGGLLLQDHNLQKLWTSEKSHRPEERVSQWRSGCELRAVGAITPPTSCFESSSLLSPSSFYFFFFFFSSIQSASVKPNG